MYTVIIHVHRYFSLRLPSFIKVNLTIYTSSFEGDYYIANFSRRASFPGFGREMTLEKSPDDHVIRLRTVFGN